MSSTTSLIASAVVNRFYKFILKRVIGKFVKHEIDLGQLKVHLTHGLIELSDLELNETVRRRGSITIGVLFAGATAPRECGWLGYRARRARLSAGRVSWAKGVPLFARDEKVTRRPRARFSIVPCGNRRARSADRAARVLVLPAHRLLTTVLAPARVRPADAE